MKESDIAQEVPGGAATETLPTADAAPQEDPAALYQGMGINTDPLQEMVPPPVTPPLPTARKKSSRHTLIDDYLEKNPQILGKLAQLVQNIDSIQYTLTEEEKQALCAGLEEYGDLGLTSDVFAARLRLLDTDFVRILRKYPEIKKSAHLLRLNRKKKLMEDFARLGLRNAAATKQLLENPEFSTDSVSQLLKSETVGDSREQAEAALRDAGVKPDEFVKVICIVGDLQAPQREIMADFGAKTVDEVLSELRKQGNDEKIV